MADKTEFKTVKPGMNLREIDEKVRRHRGSIIKRILYIVAIIIIVFVLVHLWMEMRSYKSYDIRSSIERTGSTAAKFETFQGNVIEYSNDGVSCRNGELLWNQSFEMAAPTIEMCDDYLVIYDKGGNEIYIMTGSGMQQQIETSRPIQTVCVAGQGTVAVLMKEDNISNVKLYDRKGKELANGQFYGDQGGYPIDIALSQDAKKLAIDMIDVSEGNVKSVITFYNFGSVGQNEIDNNVGSYSYSDIFIPEITYVSDDRMMAVGDKEIIFFDGSEKPSVSREIELEQDIASVFCNDRYVGVTTQNAEGDNPYHIRVYDMRGTIVMENDTALQYDTIDFLSNNEVCVRTESSCELFTIHSIKKFSYDFDSRLCYIMSQDKYQNYIFVFEDTMEEVRLK